MSGLLAEKLGMTQIFGADGRWVPVTVLKAGPCTVIQKKTKDSDGYAAVQLGFKEAKPSRKSKAEQGHSTKKGLKVFNILREFRTEHADAYAPGDLLTVELFKAGDMLDVVGVSKGKGFQGVMKRHNFGGGHATHGCSISHRAPGSIGQRTFPGKVFKNKRMAGHMGDRRVTLKNLPVAAIEAERHLLLVEGAVPGANHSLVILRSRTGDFEKRYLEGKKKDSTEAKKENA